MPKGTPHGQDELLSICDGAQNLSVGQAATLLGITQAALYHLTSAGKLHPVRARGVLVFARSDLERYRTIGVELMVTRELQRGVHPIDLFLELDGRVSMGAVQRTLAEWAKLTGVWLVEAPRGSYARWLERMQLRSISPRQLRRLLEALLTDPAIDARARSYVLDQRALNGQGDNAEVREAARKARRSALATALEPSPASAASAPPDRT